MFVSAFAEDLIRFVTIESGRARSHTNPLPDRVTFKSANEARNARGSKPRDGDALSNIRESRPSKLRRPSNQGHGYSTAGRPLRLKSKEHLQLKRRRSRKATRQTALLVFS